MKPVSRFHVQEAYMPGVFIHDDIFQASNVAICIADFVAGDGFDAAQMRVRTGMNGKVSANRI